MNFPEILQQELKSLVELPMPWAIRLLRRLALLPEVEAITIWQQEWDKASPIRRGGLVTYLGEVCLYPERSQNILGLQPPPAIFFQWNKTFGGDLEAVTGEPVLPVKISTRITQFATESTRLSMQPNGGAVTDWEKLITTIKKARKPLWTLKEDENYDQVLASTLISLGMARSKIQAYEKAAAAFLEAMAIADGLQQFPLLVNAVNQLTRLFLFGYGDVKQGLQTILPVWEKHHEETPSLDLAQLADNLANIYAFAKDPVDTNFFLNATRAQLEKAGFALPVPFDFTVALQRWARRAITRNQLGALHYNDFLRAIGLWGSNQTLQQQQESDPARSLALGQVAATFQTGYYAVLELFNNQVSIDSALMREVQPFLQNDPAKIVPEISEEVKAKIEQVDAALNIGKVTPPVVTDIEALLQGSKTPFARMHHLWRLGSAYTALENVSVADEKFAMAQQLAEQYGGLDDVLRSILYRTNLISPTQPRAVLNLCLEGVKKVEGARRNVITPYQQVTFFQGRTELYRMAIAWAQEAKAWEFFFGVGDLLKARNFYFPMVKDKVRNQLRDQLEEDYRKLAAATTPTAQAAALRQRQLAYDNWLLKHVEALPDWSPSIPVESLQAALRVGEALLSYYEISPGTWSVVLMTGSGGHQTEVNKVDPQWLKEVLADVGRIGMSSPHYRTRTMSPYTGPLPVKPFKIERSPQRALADLASFLLPPSFVDHLHGCNRLYICPQLQLHQVPFHALPWREDGFLIEAFAISYLPNLHSLLYKDNFFECKRSVALIGTDTFADQQGISLSTLAGAQEEVEGLATMYEKAQIPVVAYTGQRATRAALNAAAKNGVLEKQDVIHLALHGENVALDSPLDTRLFLRDGSINGFDITNWRLTAELVVLSACFAGVRAVAGRGLEQLPGDDIFGLQAALFTAGAHRVMGAMWPVDDRAGKELMLAFHRNLLREAPAKAWQLTVVNYLKTAPANRRELAYWAPFFLVEEGRGE